MSNTCVYFSFFLKQELFPLDIEANFVNINARTSANAFKTVITQFDGVRLTTRSAVRSILVTTVFINLVRGVRERRGGRKRGGEGKKERRER
jgi:hypothetical protein